MRTALNRIEKRIGWMITEQTRTCLNGMIGTFALQIKARGGNNSDVAEALREYARRYDERSKDTQRNAKTQGDIY